METPPPISYGTLNDAQLGVTIDPSVHRRLAPLFRKEMGEGVPQEALGNSRTIRGASKLTLWRPNNYRRQLKIRKGDFRAIAHHYPLAVVCSHNKLVTIRDYPHLTLQVGRSSVVACWRQVVVRGHKETWLVEFDEPASLKRWVAGKVAEIGALCDAALFDFVERTGLGVRGEVPVWSHFEDWVRDPGTARVPRGCLVYDSFFKKVYDEGVEFVSSPGRVPGELLSTYLSSRAFEELEPRVLAELSRLRLEHRRELELLRSEIRRLGVPLLRPRDRSQLRLGRWSSGV